jgi:hypothetical protein
MTSILLPKNFLLDELTEGIKHFMYVTQLRHDNVRDITRRWTNNLIFIRFCGQCATSFLFFLFFALALT